MKSVFTAIVLGILLSSVYANASDPSCTLSSGAITDTDDCTQEADEYTVYLYDIALCTSEPSPGNLASCEFWNPVPGYFTFTPSSTSALVVRNEIPSGSYGWLLIVQDPVMTVRGSATFANSMDGYGTSSGTKCWSRGVDVEISNISSLIRADWTAECGSSFPSTIPANNVDYDTFSVFSFLASTTFTQPSGKVEKLYLTDGNYDLATSSGAITRFLSVTPISPALTVPTNPDEAAFSITFDRSEGVNYKIDNTNDLEAVRIGTIEVTITTE